MILGLTIKGEIMGHYNGATICLYGHIVSKCKANAQPFCSQCGKETYSKCKECGAGLRGTYEQDGVIDLTGYYKKPFYCYQCGAPYPWTERVIMNAVELISLDEELDEESKKLIKDAIPDLLVDSPTTPVAVAKYKKGISKAGKVVVNALYNLFVDIVSETVKKALFGI